MVMAHRGWSSKAPENTLKAIQMAMEEPKISSIEMDVQLSKDGVPVIIHDFSVDRTTNGHGLVHNLTVEELKALDAGSWFSKENSQEKIPTLQEVLTLVQGSGTKLNLELKTAGTMYAGIERSVIDLVQRHKMEEDVILTSFDHQVIKRAHAYSSEMETGLLFYGNPTLVQEQLKYTGASVISMAYEFLTEQFLKEQAGHSHIIVWTVNTQQEVQAIQKISPAIEVCTNFPELLFDFEGA